MEMNLESVTVEDCIQMYEMKRQRTVISDGKVVGFCCEEHQEKVF